jgi:molybdenum cofactor cytidylyltransferase
MQSDATLRRRTSGAMATQSTPADDPPTVGAVVLAAGSSTRMGRNKLLLPWSGETVIQRTVRAALEAGLDPVVVVLGHEAERVRLELSDLPCTPVVNPDHAQGQGSSLRVGVAEAAIRCGAVVVLLADMPFVTASMVAAAVERYRATGAPVVVSQYGEIEAPPTLFDRALFPELLALSGDGGARQVAHRHAAEAASVAWPPEALGDLDVPEDYHRLRARRPDP